MNCWIGYAWIGKNELGLHMDSQMIIYILHRQLNNFVWRNYYPQVVHVNSTIYEVFV